MDYTAQLSVAEVECLGDPDSTFDNATKQLQQVAAWDEWGFQRCIRIKNTIEAWELKAEKDPSWTALAVLVHCEYQLLRDSAPVAPIRHNSFLSHWVEALQRLDRESAKRALAASKSHDVEMEPTAEVIAAVRAEWIQKILSGLEPDRSALGALSPRHLHDMARLSVKKPFPIQLYIRMLVEDGIYDTSHLPSTPAPAASEPTPNPPTSTPPLTNGHAPNEPSSSPRYPHTNWKETVLATLSNSPDTAVHQLTRLPLELPHLDFLTKLLTDHTLEAHAIDPTPVILSYIQHSLRTIEKMASPPPPTSTPTNGSGGGASISEEDGAAPAEQGIWEYGKEAQSRCIRLLLLFVRSLIRKRLVGVEALYFEIQELCYRYVWIGEVREFRRWVGEGGGGA